MFSVHLFIILSGLILVSSTLDQFKNNPCAQKCPPRCPPGWRMWRGSCYRLTPKLTWADAKESCKDMGGEMAAPRSLEENDFILSLLKEENEERFIWINCDDLEAEGEWICNGIQQNAMTFTTWNEGEPNDDVQSEDCAAIIIDNGHWNDYPCDLDGPALCIRAHKDQPPMYCFTTNQDGRLDKSCFRD